MRCIARIDVGFMLEGLRLFESFVDAEVAEAAGGCVDGREGAYRAHAVRQVCGVSALRGERGLRGFVDDGLLEREAA